MLLRRHISILTVIACLALFFTACDDDSDYRAPAQRMDLVGLLSDSLGNCSLMALDNGDTLLLSKTLSGYPSDTVTRCTVVFTVTKATPRNIAVISSMGEPLTTWIRSFTTISFDSIRTVSAWLGGNCLNLRAQIDDNGNAHYFGFHWLGWAVNPDSSRVAHLLLYHYGGRYSGYYTRTTTVCCPLSQLQPALRQGRDSVALLTNEFGKGPTWHVMAY